MTALQFTLFFVALLVAVALVLVRLVRLEGRFTDLARLGRIEERVAAIVQVLERSRLDPLEAALRDLRTDLRAVVEGLDRVERAVPRLAHAVPALTGSDSATLLESMPDCDRMRALVEAHLHEQGYQRVRILSDLGDSALDGETEVLVECTSLGMPCKGKLLVRDGQVQDAQIQTLASIFP